MGKFKDKVTEHYWMLVYSSAKDFENSRSFKDKFESVFRIRGKEAIDLVGNEIWKSIYRIIRETDEPEVLKSKLDPFIKVNFGEIKKNFWKFVILSVNGVEGEKSFQRYYETVFTINSKATLLIEDQLWEKIYLMIRGADSASVAMETLSNIIQFDVDKAIEMIREENPEKYELLMYMK